MSVTYMLIFFACAAFVTFFLNLMLGLNSLASILDNHWQILDLPTLFSEPGKSLLYLHAQPPMLNAVLVILHEIGSTTYNNFVLLNSFFAAGTATLIQKIVFDRSKSFLISLVLSIGYIVFPSTLLNVSYPFYPCITAFAYALLLYSFHITNTNFFRSLVYFSLASILLSITRSSFSIVHTLFFIAAFSIYHFGLRMPSKYFLVAAFTTVLFSLIIPTKNYLLYDFFGTSSWGPLNIGKGLGIPRAEGYFITPQKISEIYPAVECQFSYHEQDTTLKKNNGHPNYNSCLVIEYAKIIKDENLSGYSLITHGKNILSNTIQYFSPSDKYFFLTNRTAIASYADFINYLQLTIPLTKKYEIRLILLLILVASAFYASVFRDKFLFFCVVVIFVHYTSHSLTDGQEGQRFVFDIEFMFFIMTGLIIHSIRNYHRIGLNRLKS